MILAFLSSHDFPSHSGMDGKCTVDEPGGCWATSSCFTQGPIPGWCCGQCGCHIPNSEALWDITVFGWPSTTCWTIFCIGAAPGQTFYPQSPGLNSIMYACRSKMIGIHVPRSHNFSLAASGSQSRAQAWILKRLISLFKRSSRRGHYPREQGMRNIYIASGIPLPLNPAAQGHTLRMKKTYMIKL